MGILYLILSLAISIILVPIGLIYGLITNHRGTDRKLTRLAECIDRMGNVLCAELFNDCLLENSYHPFGDGRETISSVIGKNQQAGTLSRFGNWVNSILDRVERDHSIKNIGY